jgi:phosphatidylethanolamine-binding protein (PEBP) family uncharacterized protein
VVYLYLPILFLLTSCHLEVAGTGPEQADGDFENEQETSPIAVAPGSGPVWEALPTSAQDAGLGTANAQGSTSVAASDAGALAPSSNADTANDSAVSSAFTLTSPAFAHGARLPEQFSCNGADRSPPLSWMNAPPDTQSFALVLTSSRAARPGPNVEWVVWSIPAESRALPEGMAAGREPSNAPGTRQESLSDLQRASMDLGVDEALPATLGGALALPTPLDLVRRPRYHGPCDDQGGSYQFTLFALDATASREWGAFVSVEAVAEWLKTRENVLAQASLVAAYP